MTVLPRLSQSFTFAFHFEFQHGGVIGDEAQILLLADSVDKVFLWAS
jgi:hypothetical protein